MLPDFVDGIRLPPGGHSCTWQELLDKFCTGERRQALCGQLRQFLERARECGFVKVAVGGSFPTAEPNPGDLDLLFVVRRGLVRENLSVECSELLMNDTAFHRRFGHNGQWCSDDPEVVDALILLLGWDRRAGKDRGLLILELACL